MDIKLEALNECIDEILELAEDNYLETTIDKDTKFNLDLDVFYTLESLNVLFILTLRDKENKLYGYSVNVLDKDLHTQVLRSSCVVLYVHPNYRGVAAFNLIDATYTHAKQCNSVKHIITVPSNNDYSKVLIRKGYKELETNYVKYL